MVAITPFNSVVMIPFIADILLELMIEVVEVSPFTVELRILIADNRSF